MSRCITVYRLSCIGMNRGYIGTVRMGLKIEKYHFQQKSENWFIRRKKTIFEIVFKFSVEAETLIFLIKWFLHQWQPAKFLPDKLMYCLSIFEISEIAVLGKLVQELLQGFNFNSYEFGSRFWPQNNRFWCRIDKKDEFPSFDKEF